MRNWILGILAGVITGVAVYYLTTPKPAAAAIEIAGFVFDSSTSSVVPNALVQLSVRGSSTSQHTDSEGSYYFDVEGGTPAESATMMVEAAGYKPASINGSVQSLIHESPRLTRMPGEIHPIPTGHPPTKLIPRKDAARIVLKK